MNQLQVFKNPAFGQVRTIEEDGKVLFCLTDVAKALGYGNTRDAINRHCKGVVKRDTPTPSGVQSMNFGPEGDVYRLITHSKLPAAEDFEKWVFDEVLPSIRKTGAYINPAMAQKQALQEKRLQIMEMNAKTRQAKQMMQLWNAAGVKPQDQALALNGYYEGLELPRTVFAETTTALLDKTTIAKHLGICSKSGNPHAHAVGAIIQKLSLTDEEQTLTPYSRNGHDGEDVQYTPSVERKVFDWLEQNHYPPKVDAGNKCYSVMYKGKEV